MEQHKHIQLVLEVSIIITLKILKFISESNHNEQTDTVIVNVSSNTNIVSVLVQPYKSVTDQFSMFTMYVMSS